jgi:hypothetical protein
MNKIIVLLAVLAMTGCAETANEGAYLLGGAGRAPGGGGDDVASAPARAVAYESAPREVAPHHSHHRDADFVVCAQCRR